jgi:hypothetical protein
MTEDPIRHPRTFEPPPWEREQFDELARRRAEEEAAAERTAAAAAAAAQREGPAPEEGAAAEERPATEEGAGPEERPAAVEAQPAPVQAAAVDPTPADAADADATAAAPRTSGPEAAEVELMLVGLAAEEPKVMANAWIAWLVAAVLFALVGVSVLYLGIVGLIRNHGSATASAWSLMMDVSALAVLAAAVWMLVRALRERGA